MYENNFFETIKRRNINNSIILKKIWENPLPSPSERIKNEIKELINKLCTPE